MKRFIERVVRSTGSPDTNDLWLNDKLVLKVYENEEWKPIAGGSGGGGGEGGGCDCEPVEANPVVPAGTQTTPLEALKIGDNVYVLQGCACLAPMIVEGTLDENDMFLPVDSAPSLAEAQSHMFSGGIVYLVLLVNGEPVEFSLATMVRPNSISTAAGLYWGTLA